MSVAPGDELLVGVEAHALAVLGQDSGRAGVTFLGTERIDVLRFGPDPAGLVRYVTLGMSRRPMAVPSPHADPFAAAATATAGATDAAGAPAGVAGAAAAESDPAGPRAELVLTLRGARDSVLRRLAVLAAVPVVEGVVVGPGAGLDLGEPLWDGSACTAVLVGEPELPDFDEVRFLPVVPMTPAEAAHKRVHGAAAVLELWTAYGVDVTDPTRRSVPLGRPG